MLQGVAVLYHVFFFTMFFIQPIWGIRISWNTSVGKWALRLTGFGWVLASESQNVMVRL